MLFKPFLVDKILSGEKTMTRRLVQPGDIGQNNTVSVLKFYPEQYKECPYVSVSRNGRKLWGINRDYAVCPGRGKPSFWHAYNEFGDHLSWERWPEHWPMANPLRIRITAIRRERVCDISEADAQAEGFESREAFLEAWKQINGPKTLEADCWILEFCIAE